ncbi:putative bifunctional inhibitor/plant lipid transfer protein/seed storage helical [Helianthus annuus]|uniref:Bifunctional inhibitor/plant lipid transfer protein/seed storage helical n=1 Tax=Helianthus annuus TaxID=4232 RepID=A0A251ST98_HELAN|nr:protein YLS3 [Helianthus annuus]KAF5773579.1 putative bifunctional inhibitor/plant lipid transfer protein/seed storage helical [Helianthus annuus]KAJ0497881.1 putative bifunctional inhibitor/plant lipid transfer protein/seed storage helical [Helianthus annuus]KAJ0671378.1 putative bifunctional inhibitor/plant lipid transfer protein/seed storage helical [Helianthus annuus]KAJ0858425.1 putative bifunctional inhibitor/plant lipid transfer protein/seed storage helical [Helianthus annuus]
MLHSTSVFNFVSLNMSSKRGSINHLLPCLVMVVMMVFGVTKADLEQDKNQCTDKLVGLATCLAYVGGDAPTPPKDCCTGLKQVVTNSMVCLCILVKDHNDPSLKLKINDTLALGLPDTCHTPANISQCVGLLHLKNGSPDAKVFEDYAKLIKNTTTTTIVQPAGDAMKGNSTSSDGERRHRSLGLKSVGLLFIVVLFHLNVHKEIMCIK